MTSPPSTKTFVATAARWLPLAIFLLALGARLLPGARTIDASYAIRRK